MQHGFTANHVEEAARLRYQLEVLREQQAAMEEQVLELEEKIQQHVEFAKAAKLRDQVQVEGPGAASSCAARREQRRQELNLRSVCMSGLPRWIRRAELRSHFPTARDINIRPGTYQASALVLFRTAEEAQGIAAQGSVDVAGCTVHVWMAGDKEAGMRFCQEQDTRTVYVGGLLPTITKAELLLHFPAAEKVVLLQGKHKAFAFVTFCTPEEAQSLASLASMQLAGCTVHLTMAGDKDAGKRRFEEEENNTVHVSCLPRAITEDELQQYFPASTKVVVLQGNVNAFAFVTFGTVEEAQSVASQAVMEVAGCPAFLSLAADKDASAERDSRSLFLGRIPLAVSQADLQKCFPTAQAIRLQSKATYAYALVLLPTMQEATAMANEAQLVLGEYVIPLCLAADREACERIKEEQNKLEVYATGFPMGMTGAELKQYFPTAQNVRVLPGLRRPYAFITFATEKEAQSVASLGHMEIAGHITQLSMAGRGAEKRPLLSPAPPVLAKRQKP